MADPNHPQSTVATESAVTIRLRPSSLLMIARVRAAEATLELGLAEIQRRAGDAIHRLTRLGAARAWVSSPHPDDQAESDPLAKIREATARHFTPTSSIANRTGINISVAAVWDISGLTAEGVLTLVDRLRFDVAADAEPPALPERQPAWIDPTEQLQQMMAHVSNPSDGLSPKFVYLVRATEDQLNQATAEAYKTAKQLGERLASAAGLRIGGVQSLRFGHMASAARTDQMMSQQHCAALLGSIGYDLGEGEVATEDPRAAELSVSVFATHYLEA